MNISFLLSVLISTVITSTQVINVGDVNLNIPSPVGYTPVTNEMRELKSFLNNFDVPERIIFMSFIPENQVGESLSGKMPDIKKTLHVYGLKKYINQNITQSSFNDLKSILRDQNKEILNKMGNKIEQSTKEVMSKIGNNVGGKIDYQAKEIILLPPHHESEKSLSYSIIAKHRMKVDKETITDVESLTMTYLNLKNRLIYFSVSGGENDLEWTRKTSIDWTNSIIEANKENIISGYYRHFSNYYESVGLWIITLIGYFGVIALISRVIKAIKPE